MSFRWFGRFLLLGALLGAGMSAQATWSVIIVDTESREVAIGSATCLTGFNLKKYLPVVLVDVGAAAAQSSVDTMATNRQFIWEQMQAETHPEAIIQMLEARDARHQSRQYGIVDTRGRAATFTGTQAGAYKGGLTGRSGTLVYSIQGNVITGQPVLDQAEAAILYAPGGIPEKLMAAMEAAYDMGGDGRCSCEPTDPTGCGSPPPDFDKTAHVGFMIDSRRGDVDGVCDRPRGCANGTYYMTFNIANQTADDPDPVIQLRERFDLWRAGLVGIPDAAESRLAITPDRLLNDGVSIATMRIDVLDWQGLPAAGITDVVVEHDPAGDPGSSAIGTVIDLGNGAYEVQLTAGTTVHDDRIAVRVADATGERFLIPSGRLHVQDRRADFNHDGVVDLEDLAILLAAYRLTADGDVDGDGDTDLPDLAALLGSL